MTTIYTIVDRDADVEHAVKAIGESDIASKNTRIIALHDTRLSARGRNTGISANAGLGFAAAPHEEPSRRDRIQELLKQQGLGGREYQGLINHIERGETVIAVDVPEADAERARTILHREEK
ncbi:MAG: hypothetical protein ACOCVC_09570 [Spirochaeta sp.]